MTLLEAIKKGKWIRRHGTHKVHCVSDTPTNLYNMVRSDFLADDWEVVGEEISQDLDEAIVRFSLLELD